MSDTSTFARSLRLHVPVAIVMLTLSGNASWGTPVAAGLSLCPSVLLGAVLGRFAHIPQSAEDAGSVYFTLYTAPAVRSDVQQ